MSESHDRRIHADALHRHNRINQTRRFKRQAVIMLASVTLGAVCTPYVLLDQQILQATGTYYQAVGKAWISKGTVANPIIKISYRGTDYSVSAHAVIAHPITGCRPAPLLPKSCMGAGSGSSGGWPAYSSYAGPLRSGASEPCKIALLPERG